jgi:hypothetical protein
MSSRVSNYAEIWQNNVDALSNGNSKDNVWDRFHYCFVLGLFETSLIQIADLDSVSNWYVLWSKE